MSDYNSIIMTLHRGKRVLLYHCCQLKSSLEPNTRKKPRIVVKITMFPVRTRAQAPQAICGHQLFSQPSGNQSDRFMLKNTTWHQISPALLGTLSEMCSPSVHPSLFLHHVCRSVSLHQCLSNGCEWVPSE